MIRQTPPLASDPVVWAGQAVSHMQMAYGEANKGDQSSRAHLHRCTAIATLLARKAHGDDRVFEALAKQHKELTGCPLARNKICLGVAVLARRATTREMRAKAGKMGRAIAMLCDMPLNTVPELTAYLESQGGIERLIASKPRPALLPTELVVTCTPEQLEHVLSREGTSVSLNVEVHAADATGVKPITLLGLDTDTVANPWGDDEPVDNESFD